MSEGWREGELKPSSQVRSSVHYFSEQHSSGIPPHPMQFSNTADCSSHLKSRSLVPYRTNKHYLPKFISDGEGHSDSSSVTPYLCPARN